MTPRHCHQCSIFDALLTLLFWVSFMWVGQVDVKVFIRVGFIRYRWAYVFSSSCSMFYFLFLFFFVSESTSQALLSHYQELFSTDLSVTFIYTALKLFFFNEESWFCQYGRLNMGNAEVVNNLFFYFWAEILHRLKVGDKEKKRKESEHLLAVASADCWLPSLFYVSFFWQELIWYIMVRFFAHCTGYRLLISIYLNEFSMQVTCCYISIGWRY